MRRIHLLTKQDEWCGNATRIAQVAFPDLICYSGTRFDPFPLRTDDDVECLISFLSPWIVPSHVLKRTSLAINFHPASSNYPGIGCYNFALYEGANEYGAVVHHMAEKVDCGRLIEERLFSVFPNDTVESLKLRTMVVMLSMFHDIIGMLKSGEPLPNADLQWKRRPFTRKELNALAVITADMPPDEIARRVRATTYPGFPGPSIDLGGIRFAAAVPDRRPFA